MKNTLFLATILTITLCNACGSKEQGTGSSENEKTAEAPIVVGNTLTEIQIEKIKKFHTTFAEVYDFTLDETMKNFRGEANVDGEIIVWTHMANAYENYIINQPNEPQLSAKKEAYKLILLRSMMSDEETLQNAKLKVLSTEEAKEVLSHYRQNPERLDDYQTN
ncbi:hypothetical protein LVD17_03605 [Fulvivirga ulvae]|uniref:hypothetical protein n=1 Tax=Fulvivirga ulvae TaxID=2904245 RepID=UPI001F337BF5|nr:hypothetical protein [Fulvivirga ulvae]UII32915.1 hypothetical protein LVD17_03605 [Fulvivirga ulvae]